MVDDVGYEILERGEANLDLQVHLKAVRKGLDHPDLKQDLRRMGTDVRR
ncbi:hypothetical protein SCOCK_50181 [Actinacidiphila cocklensis]|uniref:Uncharacterized protein n=1 Tax=Actinacidiphila cocklensis TaxID=887465 RepID=A0A9W4GVW6_9ACTN|nr:hypothetical protein SCOCK_50181 [Actinacidiphila cocklensis]